MYLPNIWLESGVAIITICIQAMMMMRKYFLILLLTTRLYFRSSMIVKSPNTVCRLEERKNPAEKPALEFVNDIFNPLGRFERGWFVDLDSRLNEVNANLKRLIVAITGGSNYDLSRRRGSEFNAAANKP